MKLQKKQQFNGVFNLIVMCFFIWGKDWARFGYFKRPIFVIWANCF